MTTDATRRQMVQWAAIMDCDGMAATATGTAVQAKQPEKQSKE